VQKGNHKNIFKTRFKSFAYRELAGITCLVFFCIPFFNFITIFSQTFTPPSNSNLQLWLKGDAGVTADASNLVSSWADQSGKGRVATMSTASSKPTKITNNLNGYPTIRFDGSDYLTHNYTGAHKTMFVIGKNKGTGNRSFLGGRSSTKFGAFYLKANTASSGITMEGPTSTDGYYFANYTPSISDKFYLQSATLDESNNNTISSLFVNGSLVNYASAPGFITNPDSFGVIGGSWYKDSQSDVVTDRIDGDIAEVLIYDSVLSSTDMNTVNCYLSAKYGLYVNNCTYTPPQYSSLAVWLKADVGVVKDASNKVTSWTDQSGNGYNAEVTIGTSQPTYVPVSKNNLPSVYFDGNDTMFFQGSALNMTANVPGITFTSVLETNLPSSAKYTINIAGGTNLVRFINNRSTAGTVLSGRRTDGGGAGTLTAGANAANVWNVDNIIADFAQSDAYIYRDDTSLGSTLSFLSAGNTANTASTSIKLVDSGGLSGHFSEIMLYKKALGGDDRQNLNCYLSSRYALGITGCTIPASITPPSGSSSVCTGAVSTQQTTKTCIQTVITSGALFVDLPTTIFFSTVAVSTSESVATGTISPVIFQDLRGSGAGWSATASMTNLSGVTVPTDIIRLSTAITGGVSKFSITPGSLSVFNSDPGSLNGLADNTSTQPVTTLSSLQSNGYSNNFSIAQFGINSGEGKYKKNITMNLAVPPYMRAQVYQGTFVVSVS
jgi:hypothetical protein